MLLRPYHQLRLLVKLVSALINQSIYYILKAQYGVVISKHHVNPHHLIILIVISKIYGNYLTE
jgi:hypothetical protein